MRVRGVYFTLMGTFTTMDVASKYRRYWTQVELDAKGRRRIEEIDSAKAFLLQLFPELAVQTDVPDALIQRRLVHLLGDDSDESERNGATRLMAERCLRCFISSQIEQVCIQIEAKFGSAHGFTRYDLFPLVLDDFSEARLQKSGKYKQSSYKSFATEILHTFDPERGSLATWTIRLVKHHRELKTFLLEHGVYMVSDWAILNDTTPKQLQRIFAEFHNLTTVEAQQASILLTSYHAVYRRDRLKQRSSGVKGQCLPPTVEQLHEIAATLYQRSNRKLSPETIVTQLQKTAERLRQYRIYTRGGKPHTDSLDTPRTQLKLDRLASDSFSDSDEQDEQSEFLRFYRQQFIDCLDRAVEQVTSDRCSRLQCKNSQMEQQFLAALQLFHQGKSMGEIALRVGLQAQYQVTRLLKLKDFRADVRQQMLEALRDRILEQARAYTDPERRRDLEQRVEVALDDVVATMIHEAEIEASIAKNRNSTSLFARRLCHHLNKR